MNRNRRILVITAMVRINSLSLFFRLIYITFQIIYGIYYSTNRPTTLT